VEESESGDGCGSLAGAAEGVPMESNLWDPSCGHCTTAQWLLASQRGTKAFGG